MPLSSSILGAFVLASSLAVRTRAANVHVEDLRTYVTHPEFETPIWDLDIRFPERISSGYWFLSPYKNLHEPDTSRKGWSTPMIFDSQGHLVWSALGFDSNTVMDFKPTTILGKQRLVWSDTRRLIAYSIGPTFDDLETWDFNNTNTHELNFIKNGTLGVRTTTRHLDRDISDRDKPCRYVEDGFEAFDTKSMNATLTWWTNQDAMTASHDCGGDPFHINSVDQDHNGDFYVSGRHKDRIYKVSKDDGRVLWALHGQQNSQQNKAKIATKPWAMDSVDFARQHHVRFLEFNGTHEIISILDNAMGEDHRPPTHDMSRALVIALQPNADPPTADLVSAIPHPDGLGHWTNRRGNYQRNLPNGNSLVGWSFRALLSEHDPDGTLVMSARLRSTKLGTYRSFKYNFVGRPSYPPLAVSQAALNADNDTLTTIYVSWNGATEVASYRFFRTDSLNDTNRYEIGNEPRTGFETSMVWKGFATFVIVEAVDSEGKVLGETNTTRSSLSDGLVTSLLDKARQQEHWAEEKVQTDREKARLEQAEHAEQEKARLEQAENERKKAQEDVDDIQAAGVSQKQVWAETEDVDTSNAEIDPLYGYWYLWMLLGVLGGCAATLAAVHLINRSSLKIQYHALEEGSRRTGEYDHDDNHEKRPGSSSSLLLSASTAR